MQDHVCAIVVVYFPPSNFVTNIRAVSEQVDHVVIVVNGVHADTEDVLTEVLSHGGTTLIRNSMNVGVATALNQGAQEALDRGYHWVITLDQDSTPESTMVMQLVESADAHPNKAAIAVIAPSVTQLGHSGRPYRFLRRSSRWWQSYTYSSPDSDQVLEVSIVITSGSLVNLRILNLVGGFKDAYFIDYVDTEYCLRVQTHGFKVLVCPTATLWHQLGESRKVLGNYVVARCHSPDRIYYQYRNRILTLRAFGCRFPHWFIFDNLQATYNLVRVVLFESHRATKFSAAVQGTLDGFRGRLGPRPVGSNLIE